MSKQLVHYDSLYCDSSILWVALAKFWSGLVWSGLRWSALVWCSAEAQKSAARPRSCSSATTRRFGQHRRYSGSCGGTRRRRPRRRGLMGKDEHRCRRRRRRQHQDFAPATTDIPCLCSAAIAGLARSKPCRTAVTGPTKHSDPSLTLTVLHYSYRCPGKSGATIASQLWSRSRRVWNLLPFAAWMDGVEREKMRVELQWCRFYGIGDGLLIFTGSSGLLRQERALGVRKGV
ncbi:unnamed protein product [Diplocarpon coronariae]